MNRIGRGLMFQSGESPNVNYVTLDLCSQNLVEKRNYIGIFSHFCFQKFIFRAMFSTIHFMEINRMNRTYFYTFSSYLFLFKGKKAIKNIESNGAILHIYIIKVMFLRSSAWTEIIYQSELCSYKSSLNALFTLIIVSLSLWHLNDSQYIERNEWWITGYVYSVYQCKLNRMSYSHQSH